MGTAEILRDFHSRCHRALANLLDHCAGFTDGELNRELPGFGYPTILRQLHHLVGAEEYWIGVLRGKILVDERPEDMASIDAIRAFHARVSSVSAEFLGTLADDDFGALREFTVYGNRQFMLTPARVLFRAQTHIFSHQGQVAAMCRILGRPVPELLHFPVRE